MEAAKPVYFETPNKNQFNSKIDFIEELKIKNEKEEYIIIFGILENILVIKVVPENSKDIFYYQQSYSLTELKEVSNVFAVYENIKDIILFLKDLKYKIEEKNDDLNFRFNIFMPNGENRLIEFILKKNLQDNNHLIKYLIEENKSMKTNIKNLEENYKVEKIKNESEIKSLKENIINYKNEILILREENKKLWEEIAKLKKYHEENNTIEKPVSTLDSKILNSIDSINFILNYIKQNAPFFNFRNIKLLYRGSKDGDRTKTCHELCDNKQNVLIVMKSDTDNIFGGYSKIGFKASDKTTYLIDNNCFLFSINLKKIYPVVKNKIVICHIQEVYGLCFHEALNFRDHFMNKETTNIDISIKNSFNGFENKYEINGGKWKFKLKDIEVFQLS